MAAFGHEAESQESGGYWQLASMGVDDEEKWRYLLLVGPAGSWSSFAVLQNRHGQYRWEWEHCEWGYQTRMEPRRSFQTRALCLQNLWEAMETTHSFGGLIDDMEQWEAK